MKYPYILFDLDGTIVDTNELILQSFEHTLKEFFPGQYTRADILPHMGKTLVTQMGIWGEQSQVQDMIETYRKFNLEQHDRLVAIFPNVQETLKKLHHMGCKMAIVTSKMRLTADMALKMFDLEPYMSAVITLDDTDKHKPEPEPLLLAMQKIGASPEQTLMVGDSPYDILGGQAAGTATCGVAWSLRGPEGLKDYKPDFIIENITELLEIVRG